ncbi:MAG: NUDIX hydrolase [Eubacterium sp.]|nr:NUDIX hydrolase [Eubacterium sp.]
METIYESKYMNLYDLQYREGGHYYCASRRGKDRMVALTPDDECKKMLPDAVSCFVVLNIKGQTKKLLLNWEYRYPVGQYVLSVPAGLIDEKDWGNPDALKETAVRELYEETGIKVMDCDEVKVINPCVFSTPGMTDEGNALIYISINRDEMPEINHNGAEGSEVFEGFRLVEKEEAEEYLCKGRDEHGMYYPLFTWAALMFFMGV